MKEAVQKTLTKRWAASLPWIAAALFAIAERLLLWFVYQPVAYSDTYSYRRLAEQIMQSWQNYDGTRTPGYPLFLLWIGSDERVWIAQMTLGVLSSLLFLYLGKRLYGHYWFGALAAAAHTLNLGQVFFEANLLTETLTTFLLALASTGVILGMFSRRARSSVFSSFLAAVIALVAALAALTRPLFIYFPFWLLLFIVLAWQEEAIPEQLKQAPAYIWRSSKRSFGKIIVFALPVLLVIGGWVGFIHKMYGDWGLTTMTGYHLMQHTGVFFEYAPDEYAELRDTYIRYRDAHIAQYGTQTNTIWEAIPEMQAVSGLSFYDLSRLLARISIRLIIEKPGLYLSNVLKGWWLFWRAPVYWSPESVHWPAAVPALEKLILLQRVLLVGSNLLFLATSLGAFFWRRLRVWFKLTPALWFLAGNIWIASVVQTLLDHGDNPRFLVPLQSFVVFWALWVIVQVLPPVWRFLRVKYQR